MLYPKTTIQAPTNVGDSIKSTKKVNFNLKFYKLSYILPLLLSFLYLIYYKYNFFSSIFNLQHIEIDNNTFLHLSEKLNTNETLVEKLGKALYTDYNNIIKLLVLTTILLLAIIALFFLTL